MFFCLFRNVRMLLRGAALCQTKKHQNNVPPEIRWKQKLSEIEFRADSTAMFFCLFRNVRMLLRGGGPLPNQKTPKQRASRNSMKTEVI